MLKAHNLSKHFGGVTAVDGVSFELRAGEVTALIGPNGAGKTTLFNLLSGTTVFDRGTLSFNQRDITHASPEARARAGISRTFQLARPFRNLTVGDHMRLAMDGGVGSTGDPGSWLERVGLASLPLSLSALDLSYGQSKLLGLAMALAHPHDLLLLDEPAAGVNPVIRAQLSELLRSLRTAGMTTLIIEHDMGFVMPLADRVLVMDRGRLIADGSPESIQRDEAVLSAYLGAHV